MTEQPTIIGLISDTHGLLRKSAAEALAGVDFIIHAGDVDNPEVLESLNRIAPVYAVRGNMDLMPGVCDLKPYLRLVVDDVAIGVIHDRGTLPHDSGSDGLAALVFGHSHQPKIEENGGIVHVNPGSAGPRRFRLPVSVAIMEIHNDKIHPRILELPS